MIATLAALLVIAPSCHQDLNTVTTAEKKAGWKLLFDGKTTAGWRGFKSKSVGEGWVVENGTLMCKDPHKAGDILTEEQFGWFELQIEFNMGKGENSGILFRVTEEGKATWHSGPEIQLYDHPVEEGVETTGFLYQLYKPDAGVAAPKPAGEWNHMRILISPTKCFTEVNGAKYYEFMFGSEDFWARVNKSKFKAFPFFAKAEKGSIAIKGDHGKVAFRNIKIRVIK